MSLDKFLKISRIIVRRMVANEACDGGRVSVNKKVAKASQSVKPRDIVEIRFSGKVLKIEILEIREHASKEDALRMYREVSEI